VSDQALLHNQLMKQMAGQIQQQRAVLVSGGRCRFCLSDMIGEVVGV
jgi:hypothetical protein